MEELVLDETAEWGNRPLNAHIRGHDPRMARPLRVTPGANAPTLARARAPAWADLRLSGASGLHQDFLDEAVERLCLIGPSHSCGCGTFPESH